MNSWGVGAFANAVVGLAYLAISLTIVRGLAGSGQWRSNPLAVATGLIFFSCGVGHAIHLEHLLQNAGGARNAHDWHLGIWDLGTAVTAVWYWSLRGRFPALVRGAALFEDMEQRRRQAFEIHDNVVQGVATAKLALELGDRDRAAVALDTTLVRAKSIISDLLGEPGAGQDLRRQEGASIKPAEPAEP